MVMNRSRIGGNIITPGSQQSNVIGGKVYLPVASYPSSSSNKTYTVCEVGYSNSVAFSGETSCDCPGWTKRNPTGGRTCKHVRDYVQFLRPLWNNLNTGQSVADIPTPIPEPASQATSRDKGGNLADLFSKLDKEGL